MIYVNRSPLVQDILFQLTDDYINRGIGYSIFYKGDVVCGASSYSIYDDGIEIEVATDPNHIRKGLVECSKYSFNIGLFRKDEISKLGCSE